MDTNKILVIDDEKPTLGMFRLFLGDYGFQVLTAESGEAGLELFQAQQPDIVLTDIKMPGMDGMEVLSRIKALSPATEVIVITGHGDMDLAIRALNLDATDFINKPVGKAELDGALARAQERLRLAREHQGEIALAVDGPVAVIAVQGNITSRSEAELALAFDTAGKHGLGILLRFSESASINGAGIAILGRLMHRARDQRLPMALTGISANFRKVFDIVGLTRLAQAFDDETQARTALAGLRGA